MIWNPDEPKPKAKAMDSDTLLKWIAGTKNAVAEVEDPMKPGMKPCPNCKETILLIRGRHSGKILERHPRGGCTPNGSWR